MVFMQVALDMIRLNKRISGGYLVKDYRQKKEDKGSKRAIIASSQKIARVIFAMLMNRDEFNPERMLRAPQMQQNS